MLTINPYHRVIFTYHNLPHSNNNKIYYLKTTILYDSLSSFDIEATPTDSKESLSNLLQKDIRIDQPFLIPYSLAYFYNPNVSTCSLK